MSTSHPFLTRAVAWYGRNLRHPGRWRVVSALVSLFNLQPKGPHNVNCAGFRWILDPSDHQQAGVFWLGEMDHWECFHIAAHLPENGVLLDIGANFGYYAVTLARLSGAQVFAFEPQPLVAQHLANHIDLNGLGSQISVQPVALADADESVTLTTYAGNTGKCALSSAPGSTRVMRLDDWVAARQLDRIDVLKMDVEGVEPRVLRGAVETLRRYRPKLLLEVNNMALARQGASPSLLAQMLHQAGYSLHRIRRRSLEPLANLDDSAPPLNIFCLPDPS